MNYTLTKNDKTKVRFIIDLSQLRNIYF